MPSGATEAGPPFPVPTGAIGAGLVAMADGDILYGNVVIEAGEAGAVPKDGPLELEGEPNNPVDICTPDALIPEAPDDRVKLEGIG